MRPKEVSDALKLESIAKDHTWKVEPSCATTGEGIFEGLVSWLRIIGSLFWCKTDESRRGLSNNVKAAVPK